MPQNIITAGNATSAFSQAAGDDGTFKIVVGPNGSQVDALTISAAGAMRTPGEAWPACSANRSAVQSVTNATRTKLQANVEDFDTASAYDSATNYRFTPQIAGYYFASVVIEAGGTSSGVVATVAAVWKNGSEYLISTLLGAAGTGGAICCSGLVYLNGSTDYIEPYGQVNGTTPQFSTACRFQAHLLRAV